MLTDIEDAFWSMKSELGLRPVYHQKGNRSVYSAVYSGDIHASPTCFFQGIQLDRKLIS